MYPPVRLTVTQPAKLSFVPGDPDVVRRCYNLPHIIPSPSSLQETAHLPSSTVPAAYMPKHVYQINMRAEDGGKGLRISLLSKDFQTMPSFFFVIVRSFSPTSLSGPGPCVPDCLPILPRRNPEYARDLGMLTTSVCLGEQYLG
ncbi:hypothetical protein K445DRAFT_17860 [Daldinia sp. EC12]|nr:hypothetical protein K445DRAFT_17860 [Daldinia sp. EC12]